MTFADAGGVAGCVAVIITFWGIARKDTKNQGADQYKLNSFGEIQTKMGLALDNLESTASKHEQRWENQKEWNERKQRRVDQLCDDVAKMQGREQGREHRERL